jgi:hypothetical protein
LQRRLAFIVKPGVTQMSAGISNQPFADTAVSTPPPKKRGMSVLLALVLIFFGFVFTGGVVCIAGVWYVASNLDKWVVTLGREAIVAGINDSELPVGEKTEVIAQIDRVVAAYKEKKIDQADLERIFTDLQDSPALKALALYGIDDEFLTGTSLTKQETEQGRLTFQRAVRGVYEGKISDETVYNLLPGFEADDVRLASTNANENANDDDLRESLAKLKILADNADIPSEPFQLDIGDAVKALVDRALEGK